MVGGRGWLHWLGQILASSTLVVGYSYVGYWMLMEHAGYHAHDPDRPPFGFLWGHLIWHLRVVLTFAGARVWLAQRYNSRHGSRHGA